METPTDDPDREPEELRFEERGFPTLCIGVSERRFRGNRKKEAPGSETIPAQAGFERREERKNHPKGSGFLRKETPLVRTGIGRTRKWAWMPLLHCFVRKITED
jgi:hypothetical protein